ncbi:hypothetical protein EMVG_00226 [Emiliania huxleyi virus PS401]|nr:hypothetical protein EMVG_00226 [Emiliania huxleyi virus PS401]
MINFPAVGAAGLCVGASVYVWKMPNRPTPGTKLRAALFFVVLFSLVMAATECAGLTRRSE